jgi:hypothetical protein
MPSTLPTRNAYVADDARDAPSRDEDTAALGPHLVELDEERLIVLDVAKLRRVILVPLEGRIRRAGRHQVY